MTDKQLNKLKKIIHNDFDYQISKELNNITLCTEYYHFTGFYHIQLLIPDCVNIRYLKEIEYELNVLLFENYQIKSEMTNVQFHDKVIENDEEVILLELNFYIEEVKNEH